MLLKIEQTLYQGLTNQVEASESNGESQQPFIEQLPVQEKQLKGEGQDEEANESYKKAAIEHNEVLSSLLKEIKPINFRQQVDESKEEDELTKRHYLIRTIDEVLAIATRKNWSLCVAEGYVYIFNGAYWKPLEKEELARFLGNAAERLGVKRTLAQYFGFQKDLLQQFYASAHLSKLNNQSEAVRINLRNGTFLISPDKQELHSFNPSDFLKYQLPFAYDESAACPLFEKFLNRVLPDIEQQKILAEYLAYVFVRNQTLKLEKTLILYGSGANGKSVFFDVVFALLGSENVSTYSLQSLTTDHGYCRAHLTNKLLNYGSEISTRMDTTVFKQLVSGEPVQARQIYKESFMLQNYARLIFNANELPKDTEHTNAFFRRFIILDFGITIPEDERDPNLAKKIISSELPGVFNWVLEGLGRLMKQEKFTHSEAVAALVKDYQQTSDSVQMFLADENYEVDGLKEIPLKAVYKEYNRYCQESGYKPFSNRGFSDRLRKVNYTLTRKKQGFFVNAARKVLS